MKSSEEIIKEKHSLLAPHLNEKMIRLWSAVEAKALNRGGVSIVSRATKLSRTTIYEGMTDLDKAKKQEKSYSSLNVRKKGGGRKKLTDKDSTLLADLDSLVEPVTRGDPESPLRWTCKSTPKLAKELQNMGHKVGQRTVCDLLAELGYSLQSNRKTSEGSNNPDRNKQFLFINNKIKKFQEHGQPVISVDTKKQENIGNYKNNGQEWEPKKTPVEVNMHDFVNKENGKVAPYGIYDISANLGLVNVGIDSDTAQFAVESIRRWWNEMGKERYPKAKKLLITADCGGSNGNRVKLWKLELQKFANEAGIELHVSHFPPGTSKWNKIEHRMFCHISKNWRGRPLISREVVINLIASTKTENGLKIKAMLDENEYETGIKVSERELQEISIKRYKFHGEWNYRINPKKMY